MIVFYVMAAALTLGVVFWLGRVVLRPTSGSGVSSQRLNAAIYRDQLQALERDRVGGVISAADFETTRDELQLRLLDDTQKADVVSTMSPINFWTPRRTLALLAVSISLGAVVFYAWLGTPSAINRPETPTPADVNPQVLKMVETLAARLKENPENQKGWAMLARSYKVLSRFDEAEQAYAKAGDVVNTDANLLVDYADLLAVQANGIEGKPLELVNKALKLDPLQPTGLMMSGVAAYHRGEFAFAIRQWEKLLTVLEPGSTDAQQVEADIGQAKTKIRPGPPLKP